jgi:hypothetical protein
VLSPLEQAFLRPFFPDLDLGQVRLEKGLPRWVIGRPAGFARPYRVHLEPVAWAGPPDQRLPLLAHELAHVRQYAAVGHWRFRLRYLGEYLSGRLRGLGHEAAYRAISFEQEARAIEERVRLALVRSSTT